MENVKHDGIKFGDELFFQLVGEKARNIKLGHGSFITGFWKRYNCRSSNEQRIKQVRAQRMAFMDYDVCLEVEPE